MKKVYFYTKKNCPLCDEGLSILKYLQSTYPFHIELRDIYTKETWLEKYQIRIPVVENENGDVIDEGILSINKLNKYFSKIF